MTSLIRIIVMRSLFSSGLTLLALNFGFTTPDPLAGQVAIKEWPVPYANSRPRDPYIDSQNRVWFVGQVGNYIVDKKDMVWYAGNGNGHIGKLVPATGKITRYPMPNPEARDPHTLIADQK